MRDPRAYAQSSTTGIPLAWHSPIMLASQGKPNSWMTTAILVLWAVSCRDHAQTASIVSVTQDLYTGPGSS